MRTAGADTCADVVFCMMDVISGQRWSVASIDIAHLAGSWFSYLASTFLVGGPQIPKDPGLGGFRPISVPLVPSIWPENACVMPNSKIRIPGYLASKNPFNGFLR